MGVQGDAGSRRSGCRRQAQGNRAGRIAGELRRLVPRRRSQIDWAKPIDHVYNLIRGCNPAPGAWTTLNGKKLQIFDCPQDPVPAFRRCPGKNRRSHRRHGAKLQGHRSGRPDRSAESASSRTAKSWAAASSRSPAGSRRAACWAADSGTPVAEKRLRPAWAFFRLDARQGAALLIPATLAAKLNFRCIHRLPSFEFKPKNSAWPCRYVGFERFHG